MLSMQGYLGRVSDKSVHFFLLYNVLQILSKGNLNSNTIPRRPSPQHTHRRNESAPGEASGSFSLISHRTSSDSHTVTHTEPSQSRRAHPVLSATPPPPKRGLASHWASKGCPAGRGRRGLRPTTPQLCLLYGISKAGLPMGWASKALLSHRIVSDRSPPPHVQLTAAVTK